MRAQEFVVRTSIDGRVKREVWDGTAPLSLTHPETWKVEKGATAGLRFVCPGAEPRECPGPSREDDGAGDMYLTHPVSQKAILVRIEHARPVRPVFAQSDEPAMADGGETQLVISQGVGESLGFFGALPTRYAGRVRRKRIFRLRRITPEQAATGWARLLRLQAGYRIQARGAELTLELGGTSAPVTLSRKQSITLSPEDFLRARLSCGQNWWRAKRVPAAVAALPSSSGRPDYLQAEFEEERLWRRKLNACLATACAVFALAVWLLPSFEPVTPPQSEPIATTELVLRKPKALPPAPVAAAAPAAPPREKRIAARPPTPKKAAERPKPRPLLARAPAPRRPPQVVPPRPNPAATLARSLSFLSPNMKALSRAAPLDRAADSRFRALSQVSPQSSRSDHALARLSENIPTGEGPIQTSNARTMAVGVGLPAGARSKALNDVQGRVSLNSLYAANDRSDNASDALGSSFNTHGMSLSGDGHLAQSEIERVLSRNLHRFQYCYEKALLADPGLSGNILTQWVIGSGGDASGAKILRSQMNKGGLHQCITQVIESLRFPAAQGGQVVVKYPFNFSSTQL